MSSCRRAHLFLAFLALGVAVLLLMGWHAATRSQSRRVEQQQVQVLVQNLALTDLCLTTEARYTRHPSQADLHSAFQDHPLALEHFPSGTSIRPLLPVPPTR